MSPFALIDPGAQWLVNRVFGPTLESRLRASLRFFLCDVPKVITLLLCISLIVDTIQTWLQPQNVRRVLGGRRTLLGNGLASGIGSPLHSAVAPRCRSISAFSSVRRQLFFPACCTPGVLIAADQRFAWLDVRNRLAYTSFDLGLTVLAGVTALLLTARIWK